MPEENIVIAHRIHLKIYLDHPQDLDTQSLIPVFHRIIQEHRLDEMLIDVADYRHVPDGPGLLLIAHEADLRLDATDGRLGLLYARKRPQEGPFSERLRHTFRQTLKAARVLSDEAPNLHFRTDRWSLRLADRLHAPNRRDTLDAIQPVLRDLLTDLEVDPSPEITWEEDPRGLFGLQVRLAQAPALDTFLERLDMPVLAA